MGGAYTCLSGGWGLIRGAELLWGGANGGGASPEQGVNLGGGFPEGGAYWGAGLPCTSAELQRGRSFFVGGASAGGGA